MAKPKFCLQSPFFTLVCSALRVFVVGRSIFCLCLRGKIFFNCFSLDFFRFFRAYVRRAFGSGSGFGFGNLGFHNHTNHEDDVVNKEQSKGQYDNEQEVGGLLQPVDRAAYAFQVFRINRKNVVGVKRFVGNGVRVALTDIGVRCRRMLRYRLL